MRDAVENISRMQKRLNEAELENQILKKLLDQAGISYQNELMHIKNPDTPEEHDENQGDRIIHPDTITEEMAVQFFSYFWGRQDVYAKRSVKKATGEASYFTQCHNFWQENCPKKKGVKINCKDCASQSYKRLEKKDILAHLRGDSYNASDVIGIYPLLPNGTARFLVYDFDNHEKGAETVNLKSFKYYDRMLPAQDTLPEGGVGNLIALPLQGKALREGNSAFIDSNWNAYPNQWKIFLSKPKLSLDFIQAKISEWSDGFSEDEAAENNGEREKPWRKGRNFRQTDVDGKMEITLSNGIYVDKLNLKPYIQNAIWGSRREVRQLAILFGNVRKYNKKGEIRILK